MMATTWDESTCPSCGFLVCRFTQDRILTLGQSSTLQFLKCNDIQHVLSSTVAPGMPRIARSASFLTSDIIVNSPPSRVRGRASCSSPLTDFTCTTQEFLELRTWCYTCGSSGRASGLPRGKCLQPIAAASEKEESYYYLYVICGFKFGRNFL